MHGDARNEVRAIQFMHPGREITIVPHIEGGGCLHGRKFVHACGSYLTADNNKQCGPIMFWCEYEQPLEFKPLKERPDNTYPRYIQTLRPAHYIQNVQGEESGCTNTDPYIFGEYMLYSNCRQRHYISLRKLGPGAIIVFGSRIGGSFCFDTVFVVSKVLCKFYIGYNKKSHKIEELQNLKKNNCISENFWQATIEPLLHDDAAADCEYVLYKSATYQEGEHNKMYSFFPCKPLDDKGFPRPKAKDKRISHKMFTGIHFIHQGSGLAFDFWKSLQQDVLESGLCLGVSVEEPAE